MGSLLLTVALLGAVPSLSGSVADHRGILLAQADAPLAPPRPPEKMTHEELQAEYDMLRETRPTLVMPIVLMAVSAGLTIPGLYLLGLGVGYSLGFVIAGAVFLIPAVILGI